MKLEELRVHQLSMEIGERVWNIVLNWDFFTKDTVGKQLVRAVDSIAANLSEGFGRYHFKETKNFSYYARGSLYETKTWLTKAHNRKLISSDEFQSLGKDINSIAVKLNNYIKSIGKEVKDNNDIRDIEAEYSTNNNNPEVPINAPPAQNDRRAAPN